MKIKLVSFVTHLKQKKFIFVFFHCRRKQDIFMKNYAETVWHALYNGYSWNEIQMHDIWKGDVAQGPHLHGRVSWVNFPKLSLCFTVHFQPFQKCIPSPILASMHARAYAFKIKHASWMPGGRETSICKNNAIRTLIFKFTPRHAKKKAVVFAVGVIICFVERLLAVKKKKIKNSPLWLNRPVTNAASIINRVEVFIKFN